MQVDNTADTRAALAADSSPNRRAHPRFAVDQDSTLIFIGRGLPLAARILDLSLQGCRIRARDRLAAAPHAPVEVAFSINGIAFRFSGAVQWTDGRHIAGIRFTSVPARRLEELAEVLVEIESAEAAKAAKEAAQNLQAGRAAAPREAAPKPSLVPPATAAGPQPVPSVPASEPPAASASPADRRTHARYPVDTSAAILLVKIGSRIEGRILDLSLSGCRILTRERFPVGIYTRVETEFHLEGLPFRLGGVVQALHNRNQVGIRFLDLSDRKRAQVAELIEEIRR